MSFVQRIKEIAAKERELSGLRAKFESDRTKELSVLPAAFGFNNLPAFIKALKQAAHQKAARSSTSKAAPAGKKSKRTRVKITADIRESVIVAIKENKTNNQIAKAIGISSQSVHNIKKAAGLVRAKAE